MFVCEQEAVVIRFVIRQHREFNFNGAVMPSSDLVEVARKSQRRSRFLLQGRESNTLGFVALKG